MECLACQREFPSRIEGEVEPGGLMLCRGCGHVMAWTEELTLRELTQKEYIEAGTNQPLMRERNKIVPRRGGVQYGGSWIMTSIAIVIIAMVVAERTHLIGPIHEPSKPIPRWGNFKSPTTPWPDGHR